MLALLLLPLIPVPASNLGAEGGLCIVGRIIQRLYPSTSACCIFFEGLHHLQHINIHCLLSEKHMNLQSIWTQKRDSLCSRAAYRQLGEAGVLAGLQQYMRCCRGSSGVRCYVCASVTVLKILLPAAWRGGHLWVILWVWWLRESLLVRWPWVVVARVIPMVGQRRWQWGFGRRCG